MATKRVAGSELNHENWDQEEEAEKAGVFKKASDSELSGRVIRKARRRNVGDDAGEKKNVFAGFGGFSAAKPAAEAFSFLAKSPSEPAKNEAPAPASFLFGSTAKSDFVFGSSTKSPEPVKPSFGQFGSFGKSPEEKKPEETKISPFSSSETKPAESAPKGDLMSMFKAKTAGNWSCDICMVSNPADKIKCLACETPKPGAKQPESNGVKPVFGDSGGFKFGSSDSGVKSSGFSFGSSSGTDAGSGFSAGTTGASGSTGFSFGTPSQKETGAKTETAGFSFGEKKATPEVKPAGGFSFGAPASDKPNDSPFSFGSKSSSKPADSPAATFSFGAKPGVDKPAAFSFGAKPADSSPKADKPAAFSFGAKPADSSPKLDKPAAFSFGAKSSSDSSNSSESTSQGKANFGSFSFGAKPSDTEPTKIPETNGKRSSAASGLNKDTTETTSFGSKKPFLSDESSKNAAAPVTNNADSVGEYDEHYLAHLKALNLQVTEWIKRHVEENPLVILSPVFEDYEKHLKEISEKYPPKSSSKQSSSTSFQISNSSRSPVKPVESIKPFSFGVNSEKKAEPTSSGFAFGATSEKKSEPGPSGFSFGASSEKKTDSAPAPFSFGLSAEKKTDSGSSGFSFGTSAGASKPGGGFSFGLSGSGGMFSAPAAASTAAATEAEKEEDEDEPPKVEIKQVTEDDALYSKKCKLFYKKDGNYVEKGVGMLYLKTAENGKTQLLVRADTNLGNILLNILLNKDIPTTRVGKNNVMLVCIPNPPVDPKATTNLPTSMLIRVKTGEDADDLKTKLDEYKTK